MIQYGGTGGGGVPYMYAYVFVFFTRDFPSYITTHWSMTDIGKVVIEKHIFEMWEYNLSKYLPELSIYTATSAYVKTM